MSKMCRPFFSRLLEKDRPKKLLKVAVYSFVITAVMFTIISTIKLLPGGFKEGINLLDGMIRVAIIVVSLSAAMSACVTALAAIAVLLGLTND